jgi:flagellar protein FlbT
MALKVSLKPGEKFVINGAVIVNGDRRANLVIQNKVSILREKDVLLPQEANTPVKRIYFAIMMMYLEDKSHKEFHEEFLQRMTEFMDAISNREALERCVRIIEAVNSGEYYKGLLGCKKLLPFEEERLSYVASKLSEPAERD